MTVTVQFTGYCSTPLLLLLQPSSSVSSSSDITGQSLPFKAYEPSVEIRDKKTRSVFIEAPYKVETGEAERIAVDWTAKGGGGSTSCEYRTMLMAHTTSLMLLSGISPAGTKSCSQDASRASFGACTVRHGRHCRWAIIAGLSQNLDDGLYFRSSP